MRPSVPLPSRLAVGTLAYASVHAVCDAVKDLGVDIPMLDPERIAVAYRSERYFRIDGAQPDIWAPLSGFWETSDGWVRTHSNYPHHADALRAALALPADTGAAELSIALSERETDPLVAAITAAGGIATAVLPENSERDAALRTTPLVESIVTGAAKPRPPRNTASPLAGVRVLDLTRVIAGPVCTRTLALLGANVLRIDPPLVPEPQWQHLDTGHGKRSTLLDASSDRFGQLLASADVVVLGYRPSGLAHLGLDAESIAAAHPGIVVAQLSAWGTEEPHRRGFDSIIQAATGIAMIESADGSRPGALPAQALDHSAGYLLAAATIKALRLQRDSGETQVVRTSLRRVAAELLGMPRTSAPEEEREPDIAAHTQSFAVAGQTVTTTRSVIPGFEFTAPRPWGGDGAEW